MKKGFLNLVIISASIAAIPASATAKLTAIEGGVVIEDITLSVPSSYMSIQEAIDSLSGKSIKSDATVTIQVANGTYNAQETISINHPNADRIQLLGNTSDATQVVLNFKDSAFGMRVTGGARLKLFNGFTLVGGSNPIHGIYVNHGSGLICGPEIIVQDFNIGIMAADNSSIGCLFASSTSNSSHGFYATNNSTIEAHYSTSSNNGGSGYMSARGSSVIVNNSHSLNNGVIGYHAIEFAFVMADSVTVSGNPVSFQADRGAYIYP